MKIAILDMDDLKNPHWGSGQATATREIGKRLSKRHFVTVYSSRYPGWSDYSHEGIKYKHIGLGTKNSKLNNLAYIFCLPFTVRKIDADVILEHFTAPISTCFTPIFTKIPVIGITSFFASEEMSKKYKINFNIVRSFGIKFYKYAIALNPSHELALKRMNPKINIQVIPNGVDSKYFKRKTDEQNYILFIGRLDVYQKGLDMLLRSFKDSSRYVMENLYIVGSGSTKEDHDKLQELILRYKLSKRVELLGKVIGDKKDLLLSNAKFMVFPSRYEGQSLSMMESMSLGKSIICFDIKDLSWIDSKSALKVKPFDILKLSKSIVELSKNGKLRESLGKNARKDATKYTWEKTAARYEDFVSIAGVAPM